MPAKIVTTPLTATMARSFRKRRKEKGLSQSDLAEKVGVKRAQIKRIEGNEVSELETRLVSRIDRALGGAVSRSSGAKSSRGSSARKARGAGKSRRPSRRELKKLLEREGLLDLTLRELLG